MDFSRLLVFYFFLVVFQLLVLNMAQPQNLLLSACGKTGNFTTNSTYKSNLDSIFASLSSNTKINYGFYNESIGQNNDKVNAIALCRGDKKPETCRGCITNSSQYLKQLCPNQKEAIAWYDDCMLKYSNRSIFGNMELAPSGIMYNSNNVSNVNKFDQAVISLLDNLTNRAASGDSLRKFATGTATIKNQEKIYALTQCTPDLSKTDCTNCLNNATALIPQYLSGKQGGRILSPSCNFRYEINPFYETDSGTQSPSPPPSQLPSPNPPNPAPTGDTAPAPVSSPPPSPQAATAPQPPRNAANVIGKASKITVAFILSVSVVLL